jgi:hypothetical protein
MSVRDLVRTLVWRRVASPGAEYFALSRHGEGWRLEGTVVVSLEEQPLLLGYEVLCDARWHTRDVHVRLVAGERMIETRLEADGRGSWLRDGLPLPEVEGCLDVDIAATPSTNTLPIRRLGLPPGGSADVAAAWLQLPALGVQPLPQRYTRVGEHEYRYESNGGSFTALLTVDDLGLVTRYPGGWDRQA